MKTSLTGLSLSLSLFAVLTVNHAAFAQTEGITSVDIGCSKSSDKLEGSRRFSNSMTFSGQCVDTNKFRSVENLITNPNGIIELNNYHHDNRFWKAKVDASATNLDQVQVQIVRFPIAQVVQAAHVQLRFTFKNANSVKLVDQVSGEISTANDLVVSFEAAYPEYQQYMVSLALFDNYALVGRVLSGIQKQSESQGTTEQYLLDLSSKEKNELLVSALKRSKQIEMNLAYNALRPNCTTEIFDLIDQLTSVNNKKLPRFLTVLSLDPIAAPALQALKDRGILKAKLQNFEDEIKGIKKLIPLETIAAGQIPGFPVSMNAPWTVILISPGLQALKPSHAEAVKKIQELLSSKMPEVIDSVIGELLKTDLGQDLEGRFVVDIVKNIQPEIVKLMKQVNDRLSNDPLTLSLYLTPYSKNSILPTLESMGLNVALPFRAAAVNVTEQEKKSKEVYYWIKEGASDVADVAIQTKMPAYFMGAHLKLKIQKDNSKIVSQIMIGLNKESKAIKQETKEAKITRVNINKPDRKGRLFPIVLATHTQNLLTDEINPVINLEFGPFGGINGFEEAMGEFQVYKDTVGNCEIQSKYSPILTGKLKETAVDFPLLGQLLKGKELAIQISSVDLNTAEANVTRMRVTVETWPLSCLSNDFIDNKVLTKASSTVQDIKDEYFKPGAIKQLLQNLMSK